MKQKIQKDLDAGKFNKICSNETTFKDYVFPIIDEVFEKGLYGRYDTLKEEMKVECERKVEQAQSEVTKNILEWIKNEKEQMNIKESYEYGICTLDRLERYIKNLNKK